ncbi:MAG: hypothetical protein U0792_08155 [Gemmataceae bacterium]
MNRFAIAAAVALSLGFVTSGKADAQIVYGYTVPGAGGVYSNRSIYTPGAVQTYNSFYSPFTGTVLGQTYYSNMFGQTYSRGYGYNPYSGLGYNYGLYQPNWFVPPGGYYNYGYRRW